MTAGRPIRGKVYHAAPSDINDDFLDAPVLHVGTEGAALDRSTHVFSLGDTASMGINGFRVSRHSVVHPEVLSDDEANSAHALFYAERGLPITGAVADSVISSRQGDHSDDRIRQAAGALGRDEILQYENHTEGGGELSYIVPSPRMHLYKDRQKDPKTQPTLPLDYSGVKRSQFSNMVRDDMRSIAKADAQHSDRQLSIAKGLRVLADSSGTSTDDAKELRYKAGSYEDNAETTPFMDDSYPRVNVGSWHTGGWDMPVRRIPRRITTQSPQGNEQSTSPSASPRSTPKKRRSRRGEQFEQLQLDLRD